MRRKQGYDGQQTAKEKKKDTSEADEQNIPCQLNSALVRWWVGGLVLWWVGGLVLWWVGGLVG